MHMLHVRSHWMSPADGPASPSCTRAMPQAVAVAYTASTLGAAARCSKSTSFLPLMPLSRLVARHSRMLSRSYGGRVCGAVACVWPVLNRLLSVPCLGHKNRTRGAAQGPSKPRIAKCHNPCHPGLDLVATRTDTHTQTTVRHVRFLVKRSSDHNLQVIKGVHIGATTVRNHWQWIKVIRERERIRERTSGPEVV